MTLAYLPSRLPLKGSHRAQAQCPRLALSCRAGWRWPCPLYPRKLPRHSMAGVPA